MTLTRFKKGRIIITAMFLMLTPVGLLSPYSSAQGFTTGTGKQEIHLYFADKQSSFLTAEKRAAPDLDLAEAMGKHIVELLFSGPKTGLLRTLPADAGLRAFFLSTDGTAYVDLTKSVETRHPGGITTERLSIYSIVNSLVLNVSEIQRVKILVDGKEASTLAGHLDISRPLKADMLLIR